MNQIKKKIKFDQKFVDRIIVNFLYYYQNDYNLEDISNDQDNQYQDLYVDMISLINQVKYILYNEDIVINKESKNFRIYGDLHGNLQDLLLYFFKQGGPISFQHFFKHQKNLDFGVFQQNQQRAIQLDFDYFFLGDFCDKGFYSLDIVMILFYLKLKFPDKIYLIRGNHEETYNSYGFRIECIQKLGEYKGDKIFNLIMETFEYLSIVIILNNKYALLHGFIPYGLKNFQLLNYLQKPIKVNSIQAELEQKKWIKQFVSNEQEVKNQKHRIIFEILWNDPDQPNQLEQNDLQRYSKTKNSRGQNNEDSVIKTISCDYAIKFLEHNKLKAIIRAHETCEELQIDYNCIFTVFSALNQNFGVNVKTKKANMIEFEQGQKILAEFNIYDYELKQLFNKQLIIK